MAWLCGRVSLADNSIGPEGAEDIAMVLRDSSLPALQTLQYVLTGSCCVAEAYDWQLPLDRVSRGQH
jgi:hypothetical protein